MSNTAYNLANGDLHHVKLLRRALSADKRTRKFRKAFKQANGLSSMSPAAPNKDKGSSEAWVWTDRQVIEFCMRYGWDLGDPEYLIDSVDVTPGDAIIGFRGRLTVLKGVTLTDAVRAIQASEGTLETGSLVTPLPRVEWDSTYDGSDTEGGKKASAKQAAEAPEESGPKPTASKVLPPPEGAPETGLRIDPTDRTPSGGLRWADARTVFGEEAPAWMVPTMYWNGTHPDVPSADDRYEIRTDLLKQVLWSLRDGETPAYLVGHTGTGKTTLVEQILARLGWPMIRVNLDGDVTRSDLIGRDKLVATPEGGTRSYLEEGPAPKALRGPYTLVLDEADCARPDTAYALQAFLEGKGLTLMEGAERISPHPLSRIIATGNTRMAGDSDGLYEAPRRQSAALADRFKVWIEVAYLDRDTEAKLIHRYTDCGKQRAGRVASYMDEHRRAFLGHDVRAPVTLRGALEMARLWNALEKSGQDDTGAARFAWLSAIGNALEPEDHDVVAALAQRVFGW